MPTVHAPRHGSGPSKKVLRLWICALFPLCSRPGGRQNKRHRPTFFRVCAACVNQFLGVPGQSCLIPPEPRIYHTFYRRHINESTHTNALPNQTDTRLMDEPCANYSDRNRHATKGSSAYRKSVIMFAFILASRIVLHLLSLRMLYPRSPSNFGAPVFLS